jgi:SpoVK/Ycf46/Vps4 family AAA+-type ATPase
MPPNRTVTTVELTRPDYPARRLLWERRLADAGGSAAEDVDVAALATMFELTDAQIADAVRSATAAADGAALTTEDLLTACNEQSRSALDSLARTVDPAYSWDDIVLPASTLAHLREIAAQIRNRGTVYSEWGFEGKFSLGNGLVAMFSGPSGTGKTMATEVVANDLGLDLYKVDVASVVSKYIGETEKNLGRIFDEAERSNAILLFDEADALFGKRSEVSDSHDRYANIEASYLLQRVEEYDGAVFLTTNLESNVDDAFGRRIHHSIAFSPPDREAREAIWRGIFPAETPLDDVDYEFLSSLSVTGGNIKNIALTAAFLAADEGRPVGMGHLACAARREFEKIGKLIDPDRFEPYLDREREVAE